ncbi:MAG: Asp23/Gls24 family envelope stress response protein [Oscillospiraceae bacterium]|nr:Asp23/Gls24 family envelope stress response protein [Oscillospiraceae bacterium]
MVKIENGNGTISITSEVFTNLAGDAATNCFGVKGMAGRSKDGGALQLLRRESMSKGVEVQFNDDDSISLDLHIGVDKGVNITAVSRSIMNEVRYKLQQATGVRVQDVNVYVDTIISDKNEK